METNDGRKSMKRQWVFSLLWINLAVVVIMLIQIVVNHVSTLGALGHTLVSALVYANVTGVLGVVVLGVLVEKLAQSKLPMIPLAAAGFAAVVAAGCLLSQALLAAIGFALGSHFWQNYLYTLSIALPLALIFGLGALVHGILRGRVNNLEEQLHAKEASEERLLKLAAEARLNALEARIHPHFLFNTLNSISSLIANDPLRAEEIIGRLATLLRSSLDAGEQPLIPLRQELAMVESYLDIERVRLGSNFRGAVQVSAEVLDLQVPPMSVQSLVENSVKHGVAPLRDGGEVLVTAFVDKEKLHVEVQDTGPGFQLTSIAAGHGLDNLVQRLDALFGESAELRVFRRDSRTVVEITEPRR